MKSNTGKGKADSRRAHGKPADDRQLFEHAPTLQVGDVTLAASDDAQSRREKLARIVLDEMYQFVGLLDARGMTLEINRAALEGAGLRLGDVRGRPFWETRWWAVSQETQRVAQDAVRRARAGEFVRCNVEAYGRAAGTETVIVDFSLRPVRDAHGRVVFLLPEGRDITEMMRAEAEITRKNAELQQLLDTVRRLDAAKREFFANVSHELRTPLALILGPAEAMLAGAEPLSERQHHDLVVIHRNAATLLKHVNDLLDLEKVDAGKLTLHRARIDLVPAVRSVAAHFDALAPQRALTYVVSTPDALEADVDPGKFDRVLVNLLSNAFKFTPAGGRISCTLAPSDGDRVLLTVQDSGPGVRPELRGAIFDRFHRADGGRAGDFGGTGLGLAIARDFVDLHGGTITVSDAPAGGALFQVELPRHVPPDAYVQPEEADTGRDESNRAVDAAVEELERGIAVPVGRPEAAGRGVVLVAEDNAEMRRFIADSLVEDYRVVTASDGVEALAIALAAPPDLLVTDLMMPRLDGEGLVAEVRARAPLSQLPVLVLSAKGDEALRLKLLAESVQDYVTKPFSPHELRARVHNLVTMKLARDALQRALASRSDDLTQLTQQLIDNRQALQRSYDALQESEQRWRAVYENSAAGIALFDTDGHILAANPMLQRLLGYTEEELRRRVASNLSVEDAEAIRVKLTQLVAGEIREYHAMLRLQHSAGGTIWANASVSLIPGTPEAPRMLVAIIEDITERKRAEDRVRHLAYFDALTDLPNRVQFEARLGTAIENAQRDGEPVAVIVLALERFKEITHTLGQANGDLLLQKIGPRFRAVLDDGHLLAHFGGRHFAILLPGFGARAAREMAVRLLKTIERPFDVAGFTLGVGANLGIALFPGHGEDAASLMRCAGIALHHAHQSADGYALYAAEQDYYQPRRLQLMGELRSAIDDNQLVLYCQPKLDLKTREIVALESLVRWRHPSYGLIWPDEFVPYVESTGLIGPLTRWVIDAAVTQCHSWQKTGMRVPVAVNLSARNLADPGLIDHIQGALDTWGADVSWIGWEITESTIMAEPQVALDTLKRLSARGFQLFIDDFGTGYSSLAYLQKLPVDAIKVDKSFVLPMIEDRDAAIIVRSTLELGHNLGLEVIAEGVENAAICERLAALGYDEAQGYFLSPPIPMSEFLPWAKTAPWPLRATGAH